MEQPLVTITIPTYNSAETLGLCLQSVSMQTYTNIEILVLDGKSKDSTKNTSERYGAVFIDVEKGLLKARFEGVSRAHGEYVLLLDSDQILFPDTIARSIDEMSKSNDMLVLEENVYTHTTFLEKLFHCDRLIINSAADLDPLSGVMLPRLFRTSLLKEAMAHIPESVLAVGDRDHAIIYYEMSLFSKRISILSNAILHIEPSGIWNFLRKFFRWGQTNISAHHSRYAVLMIKKEVFRKGLFAGGLFWESLGSIILLILKGVPYKIGYYLAKVNFVLKD